MERATKPLRPKNYYSEFSIERFLREIDYPKFLFIGSKSFSDIKAKNLNIAKKIFRKKHPKEKILTIKRLKNEQIRA